MTLTCQPGTPSGNGLRLGPPSSKSRPIPLFSLYKMPLSGMGYHPTRKWVAGTWRKDHASGHLILVLPTIPRLVVSLRAWGWGWGDENSVQGHFQYWP